MKLRNHSLRFYTQISSVDVKQPVNIGKNDITPTAGSKNYIGRR